MQVRKCACSKLLNPPGHVPLAGFFIHPPIPPRGFCIGEYSLGRPSEYSADLAAKICSELAEGRSLRDVCSDEGMPAESTVRAWAVEDREGFSAHYARAREIGYHAMADELMDIADDGRNDWMERRGEGDAGWQANGENIQRSRLRVDARKWMLSKVLPKIYGDKVTQEHTGADGTPLVVSWLPAKS